MSDVVYKGRLKGVKAGMKVAGFDALVLTSNENLTYLTGFTGHESALVVAGGRATMVTDSRYTEQAKSECEGCGFYEHSSGLAKGVWEVLGKKKNIKVVGLETLCSFDAYNGFKKVIKAKVKPAKGLVEAGRRRKNNDEVKKITKASKIAYAALEETLKHLRVGITENEISGMLDFQMRRLGSQTFFDTIFCFGGNCSRNHHQPGSRKLKKNDTILIDWGAMYKSYGSDTTRCFAVGKASKMYEKVYYAVLESNLAGIAAVRPGVSMRKVDSVCRKVIAKSGLDVYGHGTGHGLGLEVHEEPRFSKAAKGELKVGDVVTIEPGIYIPGKMGVRIEDDVLVTETGGKVLSKDKGLVCDKMVLGVLKV